MSSPFTQMMAGEIPAEIVWRDPHCVALLAPRPSRPGHVLVVPRDEVDHWLDLPPEILAHLFAVAQAVGYAVHRAFPSRKVGIKVVGLEVRHVHVHLVPIDAGEDLDTGRGADASPEELAEAGARLRAALAELGLDAAANRPA